MLVVRLRIRLLEQEELELRAEHGLVSHRFRAVDLRLEHLTRRRTDGRAVVPCDIAEDKHGAFEPRNAPHRVEVGNHREIAVAALPARDLVPGDRIHLHLEREQVVAPFDRVLVLHLLNEEVRLHTLTHQASLHVGERDDDGVDVPGIDQFGELVKREHVSYLPSLATSVATAPLWLCSPTRSTNRW